MNIFKLPAIKSTFVLSNKPDQTPCHSPYLPVGKTGLGYIFFNEHLSYLFFDMSVIPKDHVISSAKLKLYFIKPYLKCKSPEFFGIQALAQPFADCSTNYRNRPSTIPKTLKKVAIPKDNCSISVEITDIVTFWHSDRLMNNGLALLPMDFGTSGFLLFHSSNSSDCSKHPVLTITTKSDKRICYEEKKSYYVSKTGGFSKAQEVWHYSLYSFIIRNIGCKKILFKLQSSPDNIDFIDDGLEIELLPGQTRILASNFFTRYNRVKFYLDPSESGTGQIEIWLQAKA